MATYYSKKHGFEFSMPDDATSEQINVEWRRRTQEVEAKQRGSGAARAGVRQEQAEAAAQAPPPEEAAYPTLGELMPEAFGPPTPEEITTGMGAAAGGGLAGGMLGGHLAGRVAPAVRKAIAPAGAGLVRRATGAGASLLTRILGGEAGMEAGAAGGAALEGEDPMEAARQVRGYGAAGEVLGAGVAGVTRAGSAVRRGGWLKKAVGPAGREATEVLGPGGVRPAQAVEGTGLARAADIADAAAGSAMFGGGGMEVAQKTQQAVLRGKLDDFIDDFGQRTTLREAGESVRGALKGRKEAFHAYGDSVAKEISEDIGNRAVTLGRTHAAMDRLLKTTPDPGATSLLKRMEEIATEHMPFDEAHGVLKMLNRMDEPTGVAKQLRKALWQDMTEAVADNPTARQKWVELGSYWKTGGKTFNQDYVKRILEKADLTDVQVVRSFLADRDPKQVMQIKNLVGKDTWRQVESSFAQDLIGTATSEAGEALATKAAEEMAGVSGKVLRRQIEKTYSPSTVAAVLGDEAAANLSKLARVLETTQAKGVSSGRLFIQMKQAGAVTALAGLTGGLVTGDPSTGLQVGLTAGGIWIGGPLLLSKIMTSPRASQYLLEGVAAKPGSGEMARAVTRLNVYLASIAKGRGAKKEPEYQAPWNVAP